MFMNNLQVLLLRISNGLRRDQLHFTDRDILEKELGADWECVFKVAPMIDPNIRHGNVRSITDVYFINREEANAK